MSASPSPEDKLLRLIKNGNAAAPAVMPSGDTAKFNLFKLEYIAGALKLLFVMVLAATAYAAVKTFVYPRKTSVGLPADLSGFIAVKPYSFYQSAMARKIFDAPVAPVEAVKEKQGPTPAEIIANLNLSGIVAGSTPKAVIEDKKAAKSYYLREGESIGDIKVEKIGGGKVILELQGEKFELVL